MMLIAETPSALDFALAVKSAISESHTVREQRGQRIKSFIEGSRLWTKQAQRFVDFTEAIIRDCPRKAED